MKKEKRIDPKKRRMVLALPLLLIPFLTMAFWALKENGPGVTKTKRLTGLNLQLPDAQLKDDGGENKLSYYEEAEKDSAKWNKEARGDLFFPGASGDSLQKQEAYNPFPAVGGEYRDSNEAKVYQKLAELNGHMVSQSSLSQKDTKQFPLNSASSFGGPLPLSTGQMTTMTNPPFEKDSEIDQLSGMMDRILDIQHPERVSQRLREGTSKSADKFFKVDANGVGYTMSLLDTAGPFEMSRLFFGSGAPDSLLRQNAIEAVIHQTQTLVDGSIVKMRLLSDIRIEGAVITKGSFVFGKASLQGERLNIEINSLRSGSAIFPVKLVVYDLDGMLGIYVPGAIARDVAKQSGSSSLQSIELSSIDPSLKGQAASAGINAAKTLLSKKAKLVRVTLKSGYKILLKEKMS